MKFLLAISLELSSVKTRKQLLKAINVLLKKELQFDYSVLFLLSKCRTSSIDFFLDPETVIKENPFCESIPLRTHSADEQGYNFDEISATRNFLPYVKGNWDPGKSSLFNLYEGNLVIGHWVLLYPADILMEDDQPHPDLMCLLVNQLSIAVSNILANEEIARREEERELLLSLSIDFAAVRNTNELLLVITQRLKNLLGFSHSTIATINEDQVTASALILDPGSISKNHPTYQDIISARQPLNDGVLDRIVASPSPIVVDLDHLNKESELPTWLKINVERGVRQLLAIRFSKGSQVFGFWLIFLEKKISMEDSRLGLTESVANQISIAVFNIIANDKIERQLSEISRYKRQLEEEKIYLKEEIETLHNYSEIVGDSSVMVKVFKLVSQVAPSESTVLILGETGTGKELIARAIHNNSKRKNKLMVKVNCAALPANLIESELFGHERGSFTGAIDRRIGKFELANGGTLFLDEIGELPLELQVKLLRALQEREIERIGGRSTIKIDVRIIAATNRDLENEMVFGRFRCDLYYRLNIFPIFLPPLRDRREDIPPLASHFIQRFAKKTGRNINALSCSVMQELKQYNWPGNIRELEHLIERSVLLSPGDTIKQIHLPLPKQHLASPSLKEDFAVRTFDEHERDFILKTLKYCDGRIAGESGAAQLLKVPASTLNSKMKRLGIRREHIV